MEEPMIGMRPRFASLGVLAACIATVSLTSTLTAGQDRPRPAAGTASATKTASRTPWGDPDLQGIWTNATSTPFERNAGAISAGQRRDAPSSQYDPNKASVGAYNDFWTERGARERGVSEGAKPGQPAHASLIVDPPDGKLPALTPAAQKYAAELEELRRPERPGTWTELNPYDRCITRGLPGAMIPGFYNHNYQIMQAPGYVAILIEMIHDVRLIPLDGRPHLGTKLRQWMGNSRGRWEGQTLVVETTDFTDKIREFSGNKQRLPNGEPLGRYEASFGTSTLTLVERFTRLDDNSIDYRFTVTDPATFARPWTVAAPMVKIAGPIHEYACHEGNYAMGNMLKIARAEDEAEAGRKPSVR
jgi:hypothetical protein